MKNIIIILTIFVFIIQFNQSYACHALMIVNPSVTENAAGDGIEINGSSHEATCGCSNMYHMDIEIRCENEMFNPMFLNPAFYGPLNDYPFFQSQILIKTVCDETPYPTLEIPYSAFCPGLNYQLRVRENHNGTVSAWSHPLNFSVPGTPTIAQLTLNPIQNSVCPGGCIDIEASLNGDCTLAPEFSWDNGSASHSTNVCPLDTTTYYVQVTEVCTGFIYEDSIVITPDLQSAFPGTMTTFSANALDNFNHVVCENDEIGLKVSNHIGDVRWQTRDHPSMPWTFTGLTLDSVALQVTLPETQFRAQICGCLDTVYSDPVTVHLTTFTTVEITDTTICFGESVNLVPSVNVSGGTFNWAPVASNDSILEITNANNTTEYHVTYEVDGCVSSDSATVFVYKNPIANFTYNTYCVGDTASFFNETLLDSSNPSPVEWHWDFDNGQTSIDMHPFTIFQSAGLYDVTLTAITNSGCNDTVTNTIEIIAPPTLTLLWQNDTLFVFGGSQYQWFFNGNYLSHSADYIVPENEGIYSVISNENGKCLSDEVVFVYEIDGETANTNEFEKSTFRLFPNPSVETVNIQGQKSIVMATVYDALGNLVWTSRYAHTVTSVTIDIQDWESGNYFVLLENIGETVVLKFQKN